MEEPSKNITDLLDRSVRRKARGGLINTCLDRVGSCVFRSPSGIDWEGQV
jgi:hypothetical protein